MGRTPGGTVAYDVFGDVFACRRGGRAIRIGSDPFYGSLHLRLAGGFAALATQTCDRYSGSCLFTEITVWNLRRYDRSARQMFGGPDGELYGDFIDMELCASGALALMLQVGANREAWFQHADRWSRIAAAAGIAPRFERDGADVWFADDDRQMTAVRCGPRRPAGAG